MKNAFKTRKDFDLQVLSLIIALKDTNNIELDLKNNQILIRNNLDSWMIPI